MAVGWFIVPYKRHPRVNIPSRYNAILDFQAQIEADGGRFAYKECLGNVAVVKVNASDATLDAVAATAGVTRIPNRFLVLGQTLGDLTAGERTAILNKLLALGFSQAEIDTTIGNTLGAWRTKTLRDVLWLALTRRMRPRYDQPSDTIVLDGWPPRSCGAVEEVDAEAA